MLFSGDLSSISGSEDSDSASEEDLQILDEERAELEKLIRPQVFHPHRVLFQNAQGQFLHAYRCVLGPHQASDNTGCCGPDFCAFTLILLADSISHFFPFFLLGVGITLDSSVLDWIGPNFRMVKCNGIKFGNRLIEV